MATIQVEDVLARTRALALRAKDEFMARPPKQRRYIIGGAILLLLVLYDCSGPSAAGACRIDLPVYRRLTDPTGATDGLTNLRVIGARDDGHGVVKCFVRLTLDVMTGTGNHVGTTEMHSFQIEKTTGDDVVTELN